MALKFEVDNLDGLDDSIKTLYTEEGGKFRLGVEGLPAGEDVSGLKTALASERDARKAAEKKTKETETAAAAAATKKAEEKGDFEQLFKSSQDKLTERDGELATLRSGIAGEKRTNAAMKMAGEMAEGENIGLLSTFIERRLQHTDDGLKVTDAAGNLTVSSVADLAKEFSADPRYASLLKGSQSSGGGASGGGTGGGSAGAQSVTREQFAALDPVAQMKHIKGGGLVTA